MAVFCRDPIWSSDPACSAFLSLIDSSTIFDVARFALRTLRPRKKWETDFGVTVGSTRATKGGQHYVGSRDMADGIAKLNQFLSEDRLGYYSRHHWGEALSVGAGIDLSREFKGAPTRVTAHATVRFRAAEASAWAGEFSDAVFELFVAMLGVSVPLTARVTWWGEASLNLEYEWLSGMAASHDRGEAIVPGTRAMLHLPPASVRILGGAEAVREDAPALDVREVPAGDNDVGIAVRLCRTPDELTESRLRAWRAYLLPVLDFPSEDRVPANWAPRPTTEWLTESNRPLDILSSDFALRPTQTSHRGATA